MYNTPAPKSSGCLRNVVLLACVIGMIYVCLYIAPHVQRNQPAVQNAPQPAWFQNFERLLPWSSQSSGAKHSVKLSSPSGSCFDMARLAAEQSGIDPTLYARQIDQESGCRASVCSAAGACGAAQLMPEMATALHVDPLNVSESLSAGAHLMSEYLRMYDGSWSLALACYNAGPGATAFALKTYGTDWLNHMPAETQIYIADILKGVQA